MVESSISRIKKYFILFILLFVFFLSSNSVSINAATSCASITCSWQPQSYCTCTDYCVTTWNPFSFVYETTCVPTCGCTRLNSDTFICDGDWGDCFPYNGSCWQQRGCSDGSTQIRSCSSCSGSGTTTGGDDSDPDTPDPSCNLEITLTPASADIYWGNSFDLTATLSNTAYCDPDYISFRSLNTSIAFPENLTIDIADSPYTTKVWGAGIGSTQIEGWAIQGINVLDTDATDVNVTSQPGPWVQTMDGDISVKGNIISNIPSTAWDENFILSGLGGYPGVAAYENNIFTGNGQISETKWNVNLYSANLLDASYKSWTNIPSFNSFKNSIASSYLINIDSNTIDTFTYDDSKKYKNTYWFYYDGRESGIDLNINSDINIGENKVVLFVDGADLLINGKINMSGGFFMAIVGKNELSKGNITLNPLVGGGFDNISDIEGLFFCEGIFSSSISSLPFHLRGSVAALDGINLQRDLGEEINNIYPAEFFEFAPDQLILIPSPLKTIKTIWREVAP